MLDSDATQFLQWASPQLGLRWRAFRRVKRQVQRRLAARLRELGLAGLDEYKAYLAQNPPEWDTLEGLYGITISRFFRDRVVFERLAQHVLPELARTLEPDAELNVWSAGCASGEEPYSVALIWQLALAQPFARHSLRVLATDRDSHLLARAERACYRSSSLRELPLAWRELAFSHDEKTWCLKPQLRRPVRFERQDLRRVLPAGRFELILCRNLVFSYFEESEQLRVLRGMIGCLAPGGYLVIGGDERLPESAPELEEEGCIFRLPR